MNVKYGIPWPVESYAIDAPTLADSTISDGMHYSTFFVRARTATPGEYFDSLPDSGYSVDNLAPAVPENFRFETLTLCPIDLKLIERSLLTAEEIAWLNDYHTWVRDTLAPHLEPEVRGHHGVEPMGLMDCRVQRNGYGRQIDSFSDSISLGNLNGSGDPFLAVFIRAPRILSVGSCVEIVATREQEPVAIRQGHCLGLTFHPELTDDQRIHKAFLTMVNR